MSEKKNSDIIKQEDHAPVEKNSTFEEFNENTLRVRRNLLIFSVIALFYKLSGATLTGKSSFLGLEFEHIDPEMIDLFLLWIVGYHLIHFIWLASEHTHHYIINRMTTENKEVNLFPSTKKIFEQTKKEYEAEYQEILLNNNNKILEQKKQYEQIKNSEAIKEKLDEELVAGVEKLRLGIEEAENRMKEINLTKSEDEKLEVSIELQNKIIENEIIKLESFINKFKVRLIIINKWRYHLMETYLPSLIGIFAFLVLVL